jgi:DNA invertase Pin-like site-specific DNA recombinase
VSDVAEPSAVHLRRDAYIYVRQSTLAQMTRNTESLHRQYDLSGRAKALGWAGNQIVVIDDDLGRSGSSAAGRRGFAELVADVGLGRAGIILSLEVSRLARNNTDWYQLLDLCALTDTLIADADGVYHPAAVNDRLLLGLKGTMSEAELHLLRSRLTEGLRNKAARGELRLNLPAGLDYDDDDQVIIAPDQAVAEAITTVFRRFGELGSARQVVVSLRADGLLLPRRNLRTGKVVWAEAGYPAVHDILTHPAYAGIFSYGRTRTEKYLGTDGKVASRQRRLPRQEWRVMIPDHHPGYISMDTFEANIAALAANKPVPAGDGGGAAREGRAWFQGLMRCGRCGRLMQVNYRHGAPAYRCGRAQQMYGAKTCQHAPDPGWPHPRQQPAHQQPTQQMDGNCLGWDCSLTGTASYVGKGGDFPDGSAALHTFFGIIAGTIPVVVVTNSNLGATNPGLGEDLTSVVETALPAATSYR